MIKNIENKLINVSEVTNLRNSFLGVLLQVANIRYDFKDIFRKIA